MTVGAVMRPWRAGRRTIAVTFHSLLMGLAVVAPSPVVAQDEVPFITTPDHVTRAMLSLARVTAADHLIDLGSGDGRIVITAARLHGARGLGVEIVPELVDRSLATARAAGVGALVDFRVQDLFATPLEAATVITMYLLPDVNMQLRPRLLRLKPGTRLVSHDWDMGDWQPDQTIELDVPDKAIGREKKSRLHLWVVPAALHGTWCTRGATLSIVQRFQRVSVDVAWRREASQVVVPNLVFDGTVDPADGVTLRSLGVVATSPAVALRLESQRLHLLRALDSVVPLPTGTVFERSTSGTCAP